MLDHTHCPHCGKCPTCGQVAPPLQGVTWGGYNPLYSGTVTVDTTGYTVTGGAVYGSDNTNTAHSDDPVS